MPTVRDLVSTSRMLDRL